MYLELDTHGLAAGTYRATLSLKKAMPGFTDETITLEVEIADANLDEVAVDSAGYDYVGNTFARGAGAKNVAKLLVVRGDVGENNYLDVYTIYNSYEVEVVATAGMNAEEKTLTEDQLQMIINFLSEMDFEATVD